VSASDGTPHFTSFAGHQSGFATVRHDGDSYAGGHTSLTSRRAGPSSKCGALIKDRSCGRSTGRTAAAGIVIERPRWGEWAAGAIARANRHRPPLTYWVTCRRQIDKYQTPFGNVPCVQSGAPATLPIDNSRDGSYTPPARAPVSVPTPVFLGENLAEFVLCVSRARRTVSCVGIFVRLPTTLMVRRGEGVHFRRSACTAWCRRPAWARQKVRAVCAAQSVQPQNIHPGRPVLDQPFPQWRAG